jgi:probable phosphoglycerate mutase
VSGESLSVATSFGVPEGVRRFVSGSGDASRIVLVRHGEAICNSLGVVGGIRGCTGLTELGRRQVAALADRLRASGELDGTSALYSSVLPRAIETAELLRPALGANVPPAIEQCDLCELHPGEADAMTWQEVVDNFAVPEWDTDPDAPIAPGGESWSGFVARVGSAVRGLVDRHPGELVVAAVHAGVIEATMIDFLAIPPDTARRGWARIRHASMTEWEWSAARSQWILLRFNDAWGIPVA